MTAWTYLDLTLRLLAALGAGAMVGLERTYHGRPAGFRTHALVCLGAAMLMAYAVFQWSLPPHLPLTDAALAGPQRIAQGVMTGIGFLGAGVIFKEGLTVHGLTTAASVWVTAALGLLIGGGFWFPAGLGLLAILLTLSALRWIEDRLTHWIFVYVTLRFARDEAMPAAQVRGLLKEAGFNSGRVRYRLDDVQGMIEYRIVASTRHAHADDALAARLNALPSLKGFELCPTDE